MTLKNKIELFIKKYDDKLHIKKITALEGTNHNVVYVDMLNLKNKIFKILFADLKITIVIAIF
jgi:hypothetical protein